VQQQDSKLRLLGQEIKQYKEQKLQLAKTLKSQMDSFESFKQRKFKDLLA